MHLPVMVPMGICLLRRKASMVDKSTSTGHFWGKGDVSVAQLGAFVKTLCMRSLRFVQITIWNFTSKQIPTLGNDSLGEVFRRKPGCLQVPLKCTRTQDE